MRCSWKRCFLFCGSVAALSLIVLGWSQPLRAQAQPKKDQPPAEDTAAAAPAMPKSSGLQIRNVSAYFAYYSSTLLPGGEVATSLGSDAEAGGSVEVGLSRYTERSAVSFSYMPSYNGRVRYSSVNSLNHALSFTANRKLTPRLTWTFSANGDYSSIDQFLFASTTLSNVASVPATFQDLATGVLTSQSANPQLSTVLGRAGIVESPLRPVLYGVRMLTSGLRTSLAYSYSPRLTLTFHGSAARSQHVSDGKTLQSSYLLLNSMGGEAGYGLSYSVSPAATIGGEVTISRTSSSFQDMYVTTSVLSVGRTVRRHWVMQAHGGVGIMRSARPSFTQSASPHPAGGGSLGFKTFFHTLLGTYEHTVSDAYGLGATSTTTAGGTWRWSRPGLNWWWEATGSYQQVQGGGFNDTSGWRTTGPLGRRLGARLAFVTQYAYLSYTTVATTRKNVSQSAVRISLMWAPGANTF